jgi:hypothetical protein
LSLKAFGQKGQRVFLNTNTPSYLISILAFGSDDGGENKKKITRVKRVIIGFCFR